MDLSLGKKVWDDEHGSGCITAYDAADGTFSVRFDNGIRWAGFDIKSYTRRLMDPVAGPLLRSIRPYLDQIWSTELRTTTIIEPGTPSAIDYSLIAHWDPKSADAEDQPDARLLSARMAETALIQYFTECGCNVDDVSARQLFDASSDDWRRGDLRIGSHLIDVKNARRSERNHRTYVHHCVPQFKKDRDGAEVQIAGTLSDWLPSEEITIGRSRIRFLGLTTKHKIQNLSRIPDRGHLLLTFDENPFGHLVLPSWTFEFPETHYNYRNQAIAKIQALITETPGCTHVLSSVDIPVLIASRIPTINVGRPLKDWQLCLAQTLVVRIQKHELSLAVIFLTIMEHFVEMLLPNSVEGFHPAGYRDLLFSRSYKDYPLCVFDPEETLINFVESLCLLWDAKSDRLAGMRMYELRNARILRARGGRNHRWITVLAYCGGWIDGKSGPKPCGTAPLLFGTSDTCPNGRLICPNCGYCCEKCSTAPSEVETLQK